MISKRSSNGGKGRKDNENAAAGKRKGVTALTKVLFVVFGVLAMLLFLGARWVFTNWNSLTIEEIVFELTSPLTGTGNNMIEKFVFLCIVPSAAFLVLLILFVRRFTSLKWYEEIMKYGLGVFILAAAVTFVYTGVQLDVVNYLVNHGKNSTYIADNYVDPSRTVLTFPEKKRNLIYIYLESIEVTDASKGVGGAFDENYIPELTRIAQENEDFSGSSNELEGAVSLMGTTWTVGSMFAQTAGLPLKIPLDTNGMSSQDTFFPRIKTIGDILEEQGYNQTIMMGSNASFGGRKLYFTEHGGYEIWDYRYAREYGYVPMNYKVWWGFEDEKLFNFAKEKLGELSQYEEPFNLTLLTVDTHFPDGYVNNLCDESEFGGNQYAQVYHSASKRIEDFLNWAKQQPWYADTTIVLSGDHPTMDADFCDGIEKNYTRKVYTVYINSAVTPKDPDRRREYSTLDDFPTTLAAMGVDIEGDRLGLGANLFSDVDTLIERDGIKDINTELTRNSEFMNEASGISKRAIAVRRAIKSMKVKVKVSTDAKGRLHFNIKGLEGLIEYEKDIKYVYIHFRNSDQLNIGSFKAVRETDGSYSVIVSPSRLGYNDITYMVRIGTHEGTIDMMDAKPYSISEGK